LKRVFDNQNIRWVLVGNGNQGSKHRLALGQSCVAVIDCSTFAEGIAGLKSIPSNFYDAVVIATPEEVKPGYVKYALQNSKHVLVEKPFELNAELCVLIKRSLTAGIFFETAYDHMFDSGVEFFVTRAKEVIQGNPSWSTIRMNYSFGTEALIFDSPWMDFGGGPWELVAPHILKILYELDDMEPNFSFGFGFSNLKSPSTVIALSSGRNLVQLSTSYTSWLNDFTLNFTWTGGSLELFGLTKWGSSEFIEYERIHPAGIPKVIQKMRFDSRTPVDAVRELHARAFSKDLVKALECDLKISKNLERCRKALLDGNYTA
jgi:predicted dehydrogenase